MNRTGVLVVGGGVVGLCSAYYLARRGFQVTVLERNGVPDGCSYGNGGIVVPSHFVPLASPGMLRAGLRMWLDPESPFAIRGLAIPEVLGWVARYLRAANRDHVKRCAPVLSALNLSSRDLYMGLAEELGDFGLERKGLLMLCRTPQALEEESELAESAQGLGLSAKIVRKGDLSQLEPGLDLSAIGGVLFGDDAHLDPGRFMQLLGGHLKNMGVRWCSAHAESIEPGRFVRVRTDKGDFGADYVVLASGVWTGRLAKTFGLRLPMLAGKGYGFTAERPCPRPQRSLILVEDRIAVTPWPDGVRFVGTMELGPPNDEVADERVEAMRRAVREAMPAYTEEDVSGALWTGQRPCSPDGMPYLGRTKAISNVVVAAGHAMMGMSLGPVSGKLVSELVAGDKPSLPIDLLSPDRYA